jgi:hypothetical protein
VKNWFIRNNLFIPMNRWIGYPQRREFLVHPETIEDLIDRLTATIIIDWERARFGRLTNSQESQ